jgi:hypothetical protein
MADNRGRLCPDGKTAANSIGCGGTIREQGKEWFTTPPQQCRSLHGATPESFPSPGQADLFFAFSRECPDASGHALSRPDSV